MSVHVTTTLRARPGHADEVIAKLSAALPESLQHEGCEAIHLRQDQDDRNHIVSFTQWGTRKNYEDYLAWRTETGFRDDMEQLLSEPQSFRFYDDIVSLTRER